MNNLKQNLCGIDEAGRGPLAGALVIAGVVLHRDIEGLMDSKKLTEKKRELLYPIIIENSHYHIVSISTKEVDDIGISASLQKALMAIKEALNGYDYLFDGNSSFGVSGIETMVKADTKIPQVSAASILAKVTRDREIVALASKYPNYGFEKHKGYGTKAHIEAIRIYGRCDIHRYSFKLKALGEV
jgi:ribonuclease HII